MRQRLLEHASHIAAAVGAMLACLCATPSFAEPSAAPAVGDQQFEPIVVEPPEPQFVAPTSRDRIGRIWAPVLIDGQGPYRLVLDTGANRSAVTAATAQRMGLPANAPVALRVTGFTGSAEVPALDVRSLEIGDFVLGPARLPVVADVFGGADGVLSLSGLKRERILADFSRDRLEITRSRGEPAPSGFEVVPLRIVDGLPTTAVRVGNVLVRAIIDTGAQRSIGNLALRNALMRTPPAADARDKIVGVTLDVQEADRVASPDIQIGRVAVHDLEMAFGDMYVFEQWGLAHEPTLAIGMDLLGSFDVVIIDYVRRELQVRLRPASR